MNKKKITYLITIFFLSFSILVTACQPKQPIDDSKNVAEEITLQFLGCSYVGDSLQPLLDQYEETHPGVKIEFQAVPFDNLNDVLTAQLSSGSTTPDIFWADQPRVPALAARGYMLDLDQYLSELEGKVFPASIVESSWNGKLYSFPVSTSSMVLFYNVELLKTAGIEPPSSDVNSRWTWEETIEAARVAKEGGAPYGLVLDQVDRYYQLQPLVESAGGGSGLTGSDNLTPDVTNDGWIKAMNFYSQIHEEEISPRGVAWEQIPDMFNNNQIAFYVSGPWTGFVSAGVENLVYGVAPHPYFEDGKVVTPTGSWSLAVNPNSEHIEEAIEFAKYISLNPEGNLAFNNSEGSPPALKEIFSTFFEQEAFTSQEGLKDIAKIIEYEVSNTSIPRPRSIGYLQFETILGTAFSDIRNGLDVTATLEKANADLVEALSQLK